MFILDDIEKVDATADAKSSAVTLEPHKNGGHMNGANLADNADTTLKCLEEPSFEFEASKESVAKTGSSAEAKRPSYRVLEDPFEATSSGPSVAPKAKGANYRVLEDPMTTAMYDPSTSSEATAAAANVAPLSSRPLASEVREGAREKFDKFWGSKSRSNAAAAPPGDSTEP